MNINNKKKTPNGSDPKKNYSGVIAMVLWSLFLIMTINYVFSLWSNANTTEIQYSDFLDLVRAEQVQKVQFTSNKITITAIAPSNPDLVGDVLGDDVDVTVTPDVEETTNKTTSTAIPGLENLSNLLGSNSTVALENTVSYYCAPLNDARIFQLLDDYGVEYGTPYIEELSPLMDILLTWILPMMFMFFLLSFLLRSMGSKMGGMGSVGKANAKVYVEKSTGVTFRDVAGQDEAKESMQEIIDILHSPEKYTEIGAKLPKGALLVGSPGTGKTLLAKAVAGEANVPFFSISGSDFVEMFVGVGASRVRDLFKEASKMAPCIIFIDEIDTIGKSRDNKMGGNDEREQTLNQLLAELDGFDPTKGVIVLAATNRPEILDKALLRPGRFDRRITVDRPNLAGRLTTLKVHTRNIRMSENVDLNKIAQATAGTVGADLANLVNEAALRAVRHGRRAVCQQDLLLAFETVIAGAEKKGTVLTDKEKRLIAYHEVGHALVAAKQKEAEPVSKITIVPHTQGALGYTLQLPEEEKFLMTRDDILTEIRTLLGGRCAEEISFQTKTTGASNDIERATDMARKMITMYGMSEKFGVMGLATIQNQYLDGGYGLNCANETAALVDQEVQSILEQCHKEATEILTTSKDMLDAISNYLLKKETITGAEMMAILAGTDPEDAVDPFDTLETIPSQPKLDAQPQVIDGMEAPAPHIHIVSEPPIAPKPTRDDSSGESN